MKIYVDKIPPDGLVITEELDPHNDSLDLNNHDISFTKSIRVQAKVIKAGNEVLVDAMLEAPIEYTCSRCLAKFLDIFRKRFNTSYEAKPGQIIIVDEDIRQEMILDYPMKSLCKSDCKGLCPNCGQNLNVESCECNIL
ncbi:MAG: DUF177 domain-containing protein [Candidatus Omnitrophota bacterium]